MSEINVHNDVHAVSMEDLLKAYAELKAIRAGNIAVIVEGGLVDSIITDTESMEHINVMVINLDIEGMDEEEMHDLSVVTMDGEENFALIGAREISYDHAFNTRGITNEEVADRL